MKKILFFTITCLIWLSPMQAQEPAPALADSTQSALVDSLEKRMQELNTAIAAIDSTTSFQDIISLKDQLLSTWAAWKDATGNAPKPNSKVGVSWWTDFVMVIWDNIWILIGTLITAIWGFFKKDPKDTVTAIGKILSKIKTRYIVIAASFIATLVGLTVFKEGAWTWPEAAISFVIALLNGIGLAEVLDWFKIRLKVPKPATE